MSDEIVIDTKLLNPYFLHGMINNGGAIKFSNYPFGVKFVGDEKKGNVEVQLFALKTGVMYKTHSNPSLKKKEKQENNLDVEEGGTIYG